MFNFTWKNNGLLVIECDISALPQRWTGDWQSDPVTTLQAVKLSVSHEEYSTIPDPARYLVNTTINVKRWLIGKDPDAGRDWGQEKKGTTEDERLDSITNSMDMSLSERREMVIDREAWCVAIHGVTKSRTWLSDWTELNNKWSASLEDQR